MTDLTSEYALPPPPPPTAPPAPTALSDPTPVPRDIDGAVPALGAPAAAFCLPPPATSSTVPTYGAFACGRMLISVRACARAHVRVR